MALILPFEGIFAFKWFKVCHYRTIILVWCLGFVLHELKVPVKFNDSAEIRSKGIGAVGGGRRGVSLLEARGTPPKNPVQNSEHRIREEDPEGRKDAWHEALLQIFTFLFHVASNFRISKIKVWKQALISGCTDKRIFDSIFGGSLKILLWQYRIVLAILWPSLRRISQKERELWPKPKCSHNLW